MLRGKRGSDCRWKRRELVGGCCMLYKCVCCTSVYTVQMLYTVQVCILYRYVYCTGVYSVQVLYTVQVLYSVQVCILYRCVYCTGVYTVQVCILYRYVYCTGVYTVQVCILYIMINTFNHSKNKPNTKSFLVSEDCFSILCKMIKLFSVIVGLYINCIMWGVC